MWHLGTSVPHDLGDPLLSATLLWWNAHTVPLTARWWDGFAFYPAHGFLAYSDHRLGESLLATPMQWFGAGPVTAYNLTLLATFPLCAISAHALGYTVTKRHDASALCGLAYGFNPYRVAHLQHLELLAAFGMPAALAALHQYARTRRARWLVIFSLALAIQGLCSSYYFLFFLVLLALWALWFLWPTDARAIAWVSIAGLAAAAILTPIAVGYFRIHRFFGFERSLDDIMTFSARLTSLVTASPLLVAWGWLARPNAPEGELFPGLTIVLVAVFGAIAALRSQTVRHDALDQLARWVLGAAALMMVVALCELVLPPWQVQVAAFSVSSQSFAKTMSLVVSGVLVAAALSSRARMAYAHRSTLAFYLLATLAMWLCASGPKPALNQMQVLYEPPYAWLMSLPVFGSVRVPARFGMLAMLTLAVGGALAFNRLPLARSRRHVAAAALMAGVVMDGSVRHLPAPALPDVWPVARADGFSAVLELPLGDVFADFAAMYRATHHRRPVINGVSGYEPTHYFTLKTALQEHDSTALDAVTTAGPVLVVIDKRADADGQWRAFAAALPRVAELGEDDRRAYFGVGRAPARRPICDGEPLPAAAIFTRHQSLDVAALTDGDILTRWTTSHAQRVGDSLTIDLGTVARPCAVAWSVGEFRKNYARSLFVETSVDGIQWAEAVAVRTAALTVEAALTDPRTVTVKVPLRAEPARFVRLRIGEPAEDAWLVAEIKVTGARPEG